jgi:hypothetical protein
VRCQFPHLYTEVKLELQKEKVAKFKQQKLEVSPDVQQSYKGRYKPTEGAKYLLSGK